nr:MAG TPA: hypothetical protein [Caudoviricetes sp.]
MVDFITLINWLINTSNSCPRAVMVLGFLFNFI